VRLLPGFFSGLNIAEASRAHVRPAGSATYARARNSTLAKIASENENDLTVYRYAVQLLECRLLRCTQGDSFTPVGAGCVAAEEPGMPVGSRRHGIRTVANAAALKLLDGGGARGRRP